MTVRYEWDVEEVAAINSAELAEGDVHDHYHCAKYSEAAEYARTAKPDEGFRFDVVLVRDDDEGRSWAYLDDDGQLPSHFLDAYDNEVAKVPQRFVREVAAAARAPA